MNAQGLLLAFAVAGTVSLPALGAMNTIACASLSFRETPYADFRCGGVLPQEAIGHSKHFELDIDDQGRIAEVRFQQGDELRAYADRFVRAPRISISHDGNREVRRFYNEWNHRTLVSGDVYEARFELDERGRRKSLAFHGLDGDVVNNDFGIARYEWRTREDGEVIEHRYNTEGELVRNRPGFGYMVTRFAYDANGLLTRMYNLGTKGEALTPDDAGVAMTQIAYDRLGRFTQWLNLGVDGRPRRGMSAIAEIRYVPSAFYSEQVADFIDADGTPQTTQWGAHRVVYEFDPFGNATSRSHYGTDGEPVNSTSGIGIIRSEWSPGGAYLLSNAYYDKHGNPVESAGSGVHAVKTDLDALGRPVSTTFTDLSGLPVVHRGAGYSTEMLEYDGEGRLVSRRFLMPDGSLVNHRTLGIARFEYEYFDDDSLKSAASFSASGQRLSATWNPAH